MSITSEFLLEEYLVKNKIYEEESKKAMLDAIHIIHLISKFIDLDFTFIREYKKTKDLIEIIENQEIEEDLFDLYLENLELHKNFTFLNFQNYIYGIIYASHITNQNNRIEIFKDLNEKISEISFNRFNKRLNLDLNDSKDVKRLYKAYNKKTIDLSVEVWKN